MKENAEHAEMTEQTEGRIKLPRVLFIPRVPRFENHVATDLSVSIGLRQ